MKKTSTEYYQNRARIHFSLNESEQQTFLNLYGVPPNTAFVKELIFQKKEIKIVTTVHDETKDDLLFQLKKIGNNLNQIAWKINANYDIDSKELTTLIDMIKTKLSEL